MFYQEHLPSREPPFVKHCEQKTGQSKPYPNHSPYKGEENSETAIAK